MATRFPVGPGADRWHRHQSDGCRYGDRYNFPCLGDGPRRADDHRLQLLGRSEGQLDAGDKRHGHHRQQRADHGDRQAGAVVQYRQCHGRQGPAHLRQRTLGAAQDRWRGLRADACLDCHARRQRRREARRAGNDHHSGRPIVGDVHGQRCRPDGYAGDGRRVGDELHFADDEAFAQRSSAAGRLRRARCGPKHHQPARRLPARFHRSGCRLPEQPDGDCRHGLRSLTGRCVASGHRSRLLHCRHRRCPDDTGHDSAGDDDERHRLYRYPGRRRFVQGSRECVRHRQRHVDARHGRHAGTAFHQHRRRHRQGSAQLRAGSADHAGPRRHAPDGQRAYGRPEHRRCRQGRPAGVGDHPRRPVHRFHTGHRPRSDRRLAGHGRCQRRRVSRADHQAGRFRCRADADPLGSRRRT